MVKELKHDSLISPWKFKYVFRFLIIFFCLFRLKLPIITSAIWLAEELIKIIWVNRSLGKKGEKIICKVDWSSEHLPQKLKYWRRKIKMLRKHKSFLIYHAFEFCQAVWVRHKIEFLIIHFMGGAMPLIFFFTFHILSSYLLLLPLFSHIIIRWREKQRCLTG